MDLFKIEGGVVKPTEHAILIPPYSDIWHQDKSKDKHEALRKFTYIEFMCSMKKSNVFKAYPPDVRAEKVISYVFKGEDFQEDELVKEGMELYQKLNLEAAPSIRYLQAALAGAEKALIFLESVDLNERNTRDLPLYKPKEITSALADTYNIVKTLNSLQEKVQEELYEEVKGRAKREINTTFED